MTDKYVGRSNGKMKAFDTEKEAMEFTEDSVALYSKDETGQLTFVRVVGIKATSEDCANFLGGKFCA